jgi:heme A synthase
MLKQKLFFGRMALTTLLLNYFVIIWGGFVSASGSGDGCGASWPTCPDLATPSSATFVEFFHRATSGLALLFVIALVILARRHFSPTQLARRAAIWSGVFIVTESLLGAGLVLFRWVDTNESVARAIVQPIHLINTFLLMGALLLTVLGSRGETLPRHLSRRLLPVLIGLVVVSSFGTFASLASTLFPSETFLAGVQKDFTRNAHYLIQLRIWHPILATLLGGYLFWLTRQFDHAELAFGILLLYMLQFALGGLNAMLLTPIWLQMVHLGMAHLLWLGVITLTVQAREVMSVTIVT